jgi:uncharacterized protein (DUF697 family)
MNAIIFYEKEMNLMEMLKKYFPYSFGVKDLGNLIVKILVYVVVSGVLGFVAGLIPFVGGIIGWVINLYCTAGWVLAILDHLKVLK